MLRARSPVSRKMRQVAATLGCGPRGDSCNSPPLAGRCPGGLHAAGAASAAGGPGGSVVRALGGDPLSPLHRAARGDEMKALLIAGWMLSGAAAAAEPAKLASPGLSYVNLKPELG